jgi:hypothetical protein
MSSPDAAAAPDRDPLVSIPDRPLAWAAVALQFGLVVFAMYCFHLEYRGTFLVLVLAWLGFVVQLFLAARLRLQVFALVSVLSLPLAVGGTRTVWIMGLGLGLMALTLVRPAGLRAAVLLAAAAVLAAGRLGKIPFLPRSRLVWAVLGSMFMFRMVSYLYSLKHKDAPTGPSRILGYFFMLPNATFPLFPVVDYKTWAKGWNDADRLAVADRGLRWMLRGVVHLLCYRLVYYYAPLDQGSLTGLLDLLQYLVGTFMLYLRVSGQFHLIVGVLHMFGFRLPETHRLYFLSSSLTDFWRRINIYWKDFMMKLVYFPSFFALRRFGNTTALVLSTLLVFVATWALHTYQWFWIQGDRLLNATDMLFWGILGVLVTINAVWESKHPKPMLNRAARWSLALGLKRLGTFTVLCLLWSLWSSDSVGEWLDLRQLLRPEPDGLIALGVFAVAAVAFGGFPLGGVDLAGAGLTPDSWKTRFRSLAEVSAVLLLSLAPVRSAMPRDARNAAAALIMTMPNAADLAQEHLGYYEQLNKGRRLGVRLWTEKAGNADEWVPVTQTSAMRPADSLLMMEFRPGSRIFNSGSHLEINQWGMRDRERALEKPAGAYRIAILGPSDVMGSGVEHGETFEAQLEARLNGSGTVHFEALNFGVPSYSPLQQLAQFEYRALRFKSDMVIFAAHSSDPFFLDRSLKAAVDARNTIPYPEVAAVVQKTGIQPGMPISQVRRLLEPYHQELLSWIYRRMGDEVRAAGAVPVIILMRLPTERIVETAGISAARASGIPVIDLQHVFPPKREDDLHVAPWDKHPNAEAHRMLADQLLTRLTELGLLPVPIAAPTTTAPTAGER